MPRPTPSRPSSAARLGSSTPCCATSTETGSRSLPPSRRARVDCSRRTSRSHLGSTRGAAVRAIQKVRLVHAAVRGGLLAKGFEGGEVPINQEDMLGTLFTFSVVVIRSLRRLGLRVEDEEADDFYHLFRVVGAMLGVRQELLPLDHASAHDLAERIFGRQIASSEHGRALMASLLAGMERHVPRVRFLPRYLVRHLVGERVAALLGLPEDELFHANVAVLRLLPGRVSRPAGALARTLSGALGRPLLEGVVAAKLGGAPATFEMPVGGGEGPRAI
ncbi:MAG TPA: oxygenase MpaB family protein [Minicystis sp.]|nr:oxygenase MpaB family protein [Minicystis sp.]